MTHDEASMTLIIGILDIIANWLLELEASMLKGALIQNKL